MNEISKMGQYALDLSARFKSLEERRKKILETIKYLQIDLKSCDLEHDQNVEELNSMFKQKTTPVVQKAVKIRSKHGTHWTTEKKALVEIEIGKLLRESPGHTNGAICRILGIEWKSCARVLKSMIEREVIRTVQTKTTVGYGKGYSKKATGYAMCIAAVESEKAA